MADKLFYSIRDVAEMLQVNTSLLRFWEKEFPWLRPAKSQGGVRRYSEQDIALLRRIHYLTRDCGYTLEGARDQIRQERRENRTALTTGQAFDPRREIEAHLLEVRQFLSTLKEEL